MHGAGVCILQTPAVLRQDYALSFCISVSFYSQQPDPETAEERFRTAASRMAARDAHDRRVDAKQRRQLRAIKKVGSTVFSGSGYPRPAFTQWTATSVE